MMKYTATDINMFKRATNITQFTTDQQNKKKEKKTVTLHLRERERGMRMRRV